MGKKLTEEQIERYNRDGFVYPIGAFTAEETGAIPAAHTFRRRWKGPHDRR